MTVIIYSMAILAVFSSYTIRLSHPLSLYWNRVMSRMASEEKVLNAHVPPPEEYHDIALLGCHQIGRSMIDELIRAGSPLVQRLLVLDFNPAMLRALRSKKIYAKFGDIGSLDTLKHAHLSEARIILSTIPDMLLKGVTNEIIVRSARTIAPQACIVATADDVIHEHRLREAGADIVVSPFSLCGIELSQRLVELADS